MKIQVFILSLLMLVVGCSNPVSLNDVAGKLPVSTEERKSVIFNVPSTNSFSTDLIYIGKLKVSGSAQADKLMQLLSIDNINIGISGSNSLVSKALLIYSLEMQKK